MFIFGLILALLIMAAIYIFDRILFEFILLFDEHQEHKKQEIK
jgi:hypothetical protein